MRSRIVSAVVVVLGVGGAGVTAQQALFAQAGVTAASPAYRPGTSGLSDPVVLKEVRPNYTSEAMRLKIQGVVELEAVVMPDGSVQQVRVSKSLDKLFGLDESAISAAQRWLFKPGVLGGKPVPVLITLILEFRLHSDGAPVPTPAPTPEHRAQAAGQGQQSDDEFTKGAYREDAPGVVPPKLRTQTHPRYTAEAMRQKIQGIVEVEAVVNPDGKVARARVRTSLDKVYGLDEAALDAIRQWTFDPNSGTLNKQPVPVIVRTFLEFRLH